MRLTVVGTGYLGAVHAACLAELGHEVLGVDTDPAKVSSLAQGIAPFYEPGLSDLLSRGVRSGRLRFSSSLAAAASFGRVHFICVGTPQLPGSLAADTSQVEAAVTELAAHVTRRCLIVGKSTVPVGTARRLAATLARTSSAGPHVEFAWNPEFLREGFAVRDTLRPARIVVGVTSSRADLILRAVYGKVLEAGTPYISTDLNTAELAKAAANAFLATKISFINAMADLCDASGADVAALAAAIGHDDRIGRGGLTAGLGFGGGCLPKDVRALLARGAELGVGDSLRFLEEVDSINSARRVRVVDIARNLAGGSLAGRNVAVLGAAFKPDTDDVRDSPALAVALAVRSEGASVRVHDPQAGTSARATHPDLCWATRVSQACRDAELVLHLTDWAQYRLADPRALRLIVRRPVLLDARNGLDLDRWRDAGWLAFGLGVRPRIPDDDIRLGDTGEVGDSAESTCVSL